MISSEILSELVPHHDPEEEFPLDASLAEIDVESPAHRIGRWASYLRYQIYRDIQEDQVLRNLVEKSGMIGTGVFQVFKSGGALDREGFPSRGGFQFGVMLFSGGAAPEGTYIRDLGLEAGRYKVPIVQASATFNPHAPSGPDGYVAAVFNPDDGAECGITARHVVEGYRRGQWVPVECSDCGHRARLKKKAPGFIDAAVVEFPCGGPSYKYAGGAQNVRSAIEGEPVEMHLGNTGKKICTVMQSLSSPSQIKCAAAPKHFLTDLYGHPGDSGSLVSGLGNGSVPADLIGIYLGDTDCEDENQNFVTYGYGLDLKQAADILGASGLIGDFNV